MDEVVESTEELAETPTETVEELSDTPAVRHIWEGRLAAFDTPTGDGRQINSGALTHRDLPLPLMAQFQNPETGGHAGATLAGNITEIWFDDQFAYGRGFFANTPEGEKAFNHVNENLMRGISVDLDSVKADITESSNGPLLKVLSARIMGATLTPFPAFAEAAMTMVAGGAEEDTDKLEIKDTDEGLQLSMFSKFTVADTVVEDDSSKVESFITNVTESDQFALAPTEPPAWWFDNPKLDRVQPVQVDADGRVFGYVAVWGSCHISYKGQCKDVPRCGSYKMFMNKTVLCSDNVLRPCGALFVNTTHADKYDKADTAADHYANTGSAVADVAIYEDEKGLLIAGAVRPNATKEMVRVLRGSDVSPDWRNVRTKKNPKGSMELVALLAVNTSGFLVESLLASGEEFIVETIDGARLGIEDSEPVSLVAAGMIRKNTVDERIAELESQVEKLTQEFTTVCSWVNDKIIYDKQYAEQLSNESLAQDLEKMKTIFLAPVLDEFRTLFSEEV